MSCVTHICHLGHRVANWQPDHASSCRAVLARWLIFVQGSALNERDLNKHNVCSAIPESEWCAPSSSVCSNHRHFCQDPDLAVGPAHEEVDSNSSSGFVKPTAFIGSPTKPFGRRRRSGIMPIFAKLKNASGFSGGCRSSGEMFHAGSTPGCSRLPRSCSVSQRPRWSVRWREQNASQKVDLCKPNKHGKRHLSTEQRCRGISFGDKETYNRRLDRKRD